MKTFPLAQDVWLGIGGHFDSITQVVCEFIDNSISNFEGKKLTTKAISIFIEKQYNNTIKFLIEDTGSGIEDFESVLKIGDKSLQTTPLNEHGFGLKHALATANPENNRWKIYSRTAEQFSKGVYKVVSAPYNFDMPDPLEVKNNTKPWGGRYNGSGTIIEFSCSATLFNTIQQGVKGSASFERCLDYLKEELGYIYAGMIKDGKATISITSNVLYAPLSVIAIEPKVVGYYKPKKGSIKYDLGDGNIEIDYTFAEISESSHIKSYKKNMSTSGLEIRVNGRLLMSNIFKDIWELENHPHYNHFLVLVDVKSGNRNALPKTRTSKNGIRSGDEKLEELFKWIRKTHPTPPRKLSGAINERELVSELAKIKEKHIRANDKRIETDFEVYKNLHGNVKVDLYVYDGNDVVLYEAKKDNADIQSMYQLLAYWDGAVDDGIQPAEGILLSSSFSKGVENVIQYLNTRKDAYGNNYNFVMTTWKDESINYPEE